MAAKKASKGRPPNGWSQAGNDYRGRPLITLTVSEETKALLGALKDATGEARGTIVDRLVAREAESKGLRKKDDSNG